MNIKKVFMIGAVLLLILLCVVFTLLFMHKELNNNILPGMAEVKPDKIVEIEANEEDFNDILQRLPVLSDSNLTVSPTRELDDLIVRYEQETIQESEKELDFAIEIMKLKNYKKAGGTMWSSEKWMKSIDYYRSLKTPELAEDCFSRPIFLYELTIFNDSRLGFERLKMFHNGFQVLFERDDMWEGILDTYEYLSSKINQESDLTTIIEAAGSLHALCTFYGLPEFKEQIRGKEEIFLSANLRTLKIFLWYLENYDPKKLGTEGTPGFFCEPCSVAQVALMLTKVVDSQKYNSIEAEVKSVKWPEKQNIEDLKNFLKLVLDRLEGVVPNEL